MEKQCVICLCEATNYVQCQRCVVVACKSCLPNSVRSCPGCRFNVPDSAIWFKQDHSVPVSISVPAKSRKNIQDILKEHRSELEQLRSSLYGTATTTATTTPARTPARTPTRTPARTHTTKRKRSSMDDESYVVCMIRIRHRHF